jgi:hypothetical protein
MRSIVSHRLRPASFPGPKFPIAGAIAIQQGFDTLWQGREIRFEQERGGEAGPKAGLQQQAAIRSF